MAKQKFTAARGGRPERKGQKKPARDSHRADSPRTGSTLPHLYGRHAVLAALANPTRRIRRLWHTAEAGDRFKTDIESALKDGGHDHVEINTIDKRQLEDRLPAGAVHQGLALEAEAPAGQHIEDIIKKTQDDPRATVVILDQATDPHNIGAILRSAAAFGAAALIVQDRHAPEVTGTIAKAASGALERVALVRVTNLARAMDKLKEAGYWCIGLDGHAEQNLGKADLSGRVALVLGAEGAGLRRLTRENCDLLLKVQISGAVESLNLSNAAAIALYERSRN